MRHFRFNMRNIQKKKKLKHTKVFHKNFNWRRSKMMRRFYEWDENMLCCSSPEFFLEKGFILKIFCRQSVGIFWVKCRNFIEENLGQLRSFNSYRISEFFFPNPLGPTKALTLDGGSLIMVLKIPKTSSILMLKTSFFDSLVFYSFIFFFLI